MVLTRENVHEIINDKKKCYNTNIDELKNNYELRESSLYNTTSSSLTWLFYRDVIIIKSKDNKIESKKCIKDYVNAIQDCNPFNTDECETFMTTFSSNSKQHESIRQWISNYIIKYSFYKPIIELALKKVVKNDEILLKVDILPEHLINSGNDAFYILLCISREIPHVIEKSVRIQLTKYLLDIEKLQKKGSKRLFNNDNDSDNDNNDNKNNNNSNNNYHDTNDVNWKGNKNDSINYNKNGTDINYENSNAVNKRIKTGLRKLLILDLNGVLIHSKKKKNRNNKFTLRPHVHSFIYAMSKRYQLAVWTSKTFERAESIVQQLFHSYDLLFTWYNDKCDRKHERNLLYMIKDLRKVWNQFDKYDKTNTILLDDSEEKCTVNNSYNCIHPRRFVKKGTDHLKKTPNENDNVLKEDDELISDGNLHNYLDKLSCFQGSVRSFVQDNKHYNDS